jgi:small-conductance mechanosensitive channel
MTEYFNQVYFENTLLDYSIALSIIVIGILLIRIFKRTILARIKIYAQKTETHFDDFIVNGIERFGIPALYYTIIYIGLSYLTFSPRGQNILRLATTVVITFLIVRLFSSVIQLILQSVVRRQERGEEKVKQLGGLMLIINAFIWLFGLIFLFDNLGYDVTTVITGLGIGGIAIALAAQNILGDLFNYFVIFFDRPFETGDFIIIDEKMGEVDYIGIKTTRLKSLSGEQLIFANSDLTNSRIHNYKRMQRRRITFKFGVIYQTSLENLKTIPGLVRSIIEEQDNVTFDRAHFASYGDSSLDFEAVYYILSSEYAAYMNAQQEINFRLFEEFQNRGIDFAYPTRTLFIQGPGSESQPEPAGSIPAPFTGSR